MNQAQNLSECPLCLSALTQPLSPSGSSVANQRVDCPNCGLFQITHQARVNARRLDQDQRAIAAYQVRQRKPDALVKTDDLDRWERDATLPAPMERIDLLLRLMAQDRAPGHDMQLKDVNLRARLGCADMPGLRWVRDQALALGYLTEGPHNSHHSLSIAGWQRVHELERSGAGSQHAFMAMKFGDAQLDAVFSQHMRPAVRRTGFELRTTAGPHQTAGLIDNRMRVEIRTARFLVCDLTHSNRGAYWEAGFAEGLGRPVIYTCRRDVLKSDDKETAPHFDTAHQLIIPWDLATIDACMAELADTIRATMPDEATLEDPPAKSG